MPQYDIEIRNTNVASDLPDCVIVLDFAKASADCQAWLYANAKSDGTDMRVYLSDGVTQLNHDLISFNKPGTDQVAGYMKILIPNVDSSSNTPLRLDCDGARSDGSTTATYPSSWKYYSPFNGNANDRTSNANNGTVFGASSATGQVADGLSFVAADQDYVVTGNGAISPGTGAWTLEMWIKTTSSGYYEIFRDYGLSGTSTINLYQWTDNKLYFGVRDQASVLLEIGTTSTTAHRDGNWHLICVSRTSQTTLAMCIDGVQVASGSNGSLSYVDISGARGPEFGRFSNASSASAAGYFTGLMDEPVISLATYTAGRSLFRYHNESSSDNEIDYIGAVVVATAKPWLYCRGSQLIGGGIL